MLCKGYKIMKQKSILIRNLRNNQANLKLSLLSSSKLSQGNFVDLTRKGATGRLVRKMEKSQQFLAVTKVLYSSKKNTQICSNESYENWFAFSQIGVTVSLGNSSRFRRASLSCALAVCSQSNYDSQSSGTKGFGKKFLARICCMFRREPGSPCSVQHDC